MNKDLKNKKRGFTLLVAVMTTSLLLLVSFVVANIAYKQIILSSLNKESQYAFYNAESGLECAWYSDIKDPTASPFDTGAAPQFGEIFIAEYSGIDTVSPLDKYSGTTGSLTATPTYQIFGTNPITTTFANELIFGFGSHWAEDSNAGPGFTERSTGRSIIEDMLVNSNY